MARAIMLQGTGSDVGKTLLTAGLCRVARRRGLNVRPFKPQNMSNNAAVAVIPGSTEAGEIGRAQWLQALACGIEPSVDMNPVLLKPQSDTGSQIIVAGKVAGSAAARDYQAMKGGLLDAVLQSFGRLKQEADLVIVEGAGSAAEINLREGDIANMGFATAGRVPVVLVGDINRGGVIASLVGTHAILPETDRDMVCGYLINKFRGDVSLFDNGLEAITGHTGWRSFGVVPYLQEARTLPPEDSVVLEELSGRGGGDIKVAVPVLSRIANFDDLDPLRAEPSVNLLFIRPGERVPSDATLVVIPGSKSTIADIKAFRENGWDDDLRRVRQAGGYIAGLCGGYQMLGNMVRDPDCIEGEDREIAGLGLLDIETVMEPEKTVRNTSARSIRFDAAVEGYEIHLGLTTGPDCSRPVLRMGDRVDGAVSEDSKVWGTYLHGIFGADDFRHQLLESLGASGPMVRYRQSVETALDRIADTLERTVDCQAIFDAAA
ncbi:MAG: cobyric acid synthase [Rhizobiaceae bacterium]